MNNLAIVKQGIEIIPFSNPGEIDPRMWSTFGVSVKETNNAIGQFGTGLKYAIAVLMREGRSLVIVSGGKRYEFGVKQTDIRGKGFAHVTCNGEFLPFTTHLGSGWDLWQAYRELYSNCLDEGGEISDAGDTVIYAEIGDINHHDVFLNKSDRTLLVSSQYCNVYSGSSSWIYNKGIKTAMLPEVAMYTYDLKGAALTEDRTLKYSIDIDEAISTAVIEGEDTEFAERFLLSSKGSFEEGIRFAWCKKAPSGNLLNLVNRYRKDRIYMQENLLRVALEKLGAAIYSVSEMDARQSKITQKAKDFCALIGYQINFPIVMSRDLGSKTLAVANRSTQQIYLSDRVLDQGVKQVASALIEENLHLSKGLDDCTYEMQTYLFEQIVTMGERLTGEIL